MADVTFEQVKQLIEQMLPAELDRLRAWLIVSKIGETESDLDKGHWGKHLLAVIHQFNLDEADQMNIPDPEAWVREYRRTQTQRRNPGWGSE